MFGLNPQITNLAIILFFMQASKKIPFEDESVLMGVRLLYVFSNLAIAGLYFYVMRVINAKKDMTTIKYVEPAQMGSQEEPKLVTTTIHSYDMGQVRKAFQGQAMGCAMMAFMHLYMKYTNPLLIQSIIPLKGALESNIVQIHLFSAPATGDLKRPFKVAAGMMSALSGGAAGGGELKTDKASIEAAERAGRGGAKEE